MNEERKQRFAQEVLEGLSSDPKFISSKYFYDKAGDRLFREITRVPEYYLTRSELEIMQTKADDLISQLKSINGKLSVVELGAGDGSKTEVLLKQILEKKMDLKFIPTDISQNTLEFIQQNFEKSIPGLEVVPERGEFFKVLKKLQTIKGQKLVLFLGSTIGNFSQKDSLAFFKQLNQFMSEGDYLLTGFDLVKDPWKIYNAYHDSLGLTKAFNLNLLERCNRELNTDFNIEKFDHYPVYDPAQQMAKSYLVSLADQTVHFKDFHKNIHFTEGETIFTEVSTKFTLKDIEAFCRDADFQFIQHFLDSKQFFCDSLWRKG